MQDPNSLSPRSGRFFTGLSVQASTLNALILRVLQQRYGRNNIGYLWVMGEPMMLATVITLLHAAVAGHNGDAGMSPFTFMLTGYGIYCFFRNSFNRSESMLHGGETLMYHRMITPFDIVAANVIVEAIGCATAVIVLQTIGIIAGVSDLPVRPVYLIEAFCLYVWLTFGMCLIIAAYAYRSPIISRLSHPFAYFMLPLSGAFFTMSFLPPWAREILAWNPMVTVFEMARYGQFQQVKETYIYTEYLVAVSASLTYWGMLEIRRVRNFIHAP